MNILGVSLVHSKGGGERSYTSVAAGLAQKGHRVITIIAARSPLGEMLRAAGCETLEMDIKKPDGIAGLPSGVIKLLRALPSGPFDAIYGNSYVSAKWIALLKARLRRPCVIHLRESEYGEYGSFRSRFTAGFIDHAIAISNAVGMEYCQRARFPTDRLSVVPNGVPESLPVSASHPIDAFLRSKGVMENPGTNSLKIVLVGREDALKGHRILIEALALLRSKGVPATAFLVGVESTTSYGVELTSLAQELSVGQHLFLTGWTEDSRSWMADADLVVVPSLAEGFGRVVIEAMAEGTPVVASDVGGIPEIIEDGVSGILVPPGNPQMLANAIATCHHKPDYRRQLAEGGSLRFRQNFSEERMVAGVEEVLLRCCS